MSKASWRGLHRAAALALAPVVALGFTRFAYALLLPGMQASLHWNLAQAGALNTANGVGFLLGALSASRLARRAGAVRVFTASLLLSAMALLVTAWLQDWIGFLLARALGGASTAWAFVIGSALAPCVMPQRPAAALAIYFGGTGLGMVLAGSAWSGWVLWGEASWRAGWGWMGAAAAVATLVSTAAVRHLRDTAAGTDDAAPARRPLRTAIAPTLAANVLYGAGYVGYTTFVIALLQARGFGSFAGALVFCLIGAASMLASPAWGQWLERRPGGQGFAIVNLLLALSLVPVLTSDHLAAVIASATLFGAVFMAGPAAVGLIAQRELPVADLARGLGALTAAFSFGQSVGPLLSGAVADVAGALEAGLWVGPVLLLAGCATALAQGRPTTQRATMPT